MGETAETNPLPKLKMNCAVALLVRIGEELRRLQSVHYRKNRKAPLLQYRQIGGSSYAPSLDDVDSNQEKSIESPLVQTDYEDGLEEKVSRLSGSVEVIMKELKDLTKMMHNQRPKSVSRPQKKAQF